MQAAGRLLLRLLLREALGDLIEAPHAVLGVLVMDVEALRVLDFLEPAGDLQVAGPAGTLARTGIGSPRRNAWMPTAALWPSRIASITLAGPV